MDDDIDIEEHDLMDNPRIKSIFPDLSRVKIEIPDDDDVEENFDELQQEETMKQEMEQSQETPYHYEYSFESTPDDVQEDSDCDEHNNYFYNNEIILGSKPPIDPEVLYEEALNSHPIVYLENWEDKLKSSPCYCESCTILFPTVNALDAHKMISHSYLVAMETPQRNTARKSTVTSKYCNHCSKMFPDDTSLIKHLYELLPLNNYPAVKDEPKELTPKPKQTSTILHFPQKVKNTNQVITKIHPKKVKIEPKESKSDLKCSKSVLKVMEKSKVKVKLQRDGKFFAQSSLVPKSTLFQCSTCQIGFVSCFSAIQHGKSCGKLLPFTKCKVCKRKIRNKDVKIHELQHSYNDRLKIYTINKSIYERVLCKCPKCLACYDELGFWAHYEKCKKSDKKCYCPECDVHIAAARYDSHKNKHTTKKLTKKDFIIIEFHDKKNTQEKRKVEVVRRQKIKKIQHGPDKELNISLYYCETCSCCQYKLQYKGHTDGMCQKNFYKRYCDKCGLSFTQKSIFSHLVLHKKLNFSLKDIKLYSLATGKEIKPPVPEMFNCDNCSIHFLYRRELQAHDCNTEKSVSCKICQKKFNIAAFKIHKQFHFGDHLIPELMKKYDSLNNIWNIIYQCKTCNLVTMTYDSAVNHSQGHLNYIISDFHKICKKCDFKIAEKEFFLHEKLHLHNKAINRESFRILTYTYEDLFKKEWFSLFKGLPSQKQIMQILSKSIYKYTRSVKMHIEVSASTDEFIYLCMNCNTFLDGVTSTVAEHLASKCTKSNKYICKTCNETFKTLNQFLTHEGSHENDIKSTIVSFNSEFDKEFNNHLSLIEKKMKLNKNPSSPSIPTDGGSKKMYKVYKCARCKCCVSMKHNVTRHNCVPDSGKTFCAKCDLYFSNKKVLTHFETHRKKPDLKKGTLSVVYFDGAEQKPETVAKIFKCDCGLHFTNLKSIQNHLDECGPELKVSKEICSQCNLLFPTDVLVTHLVNHHSKLTNIAIERVVKNNLYKCSQCAQLFTSMEFYDEHIESQNCSPNKGCKCPECRLSFGKNCVSKHMCSFKDTTIINKITTMKKSINFFTAFRCADCDISYLNYKSFKYHILEVNHVNKLPLITCEYCGLRFTNFSFRKHIKLHSVKNEEFKIKVINPVSGDSVFITGNTNDKSDGNTESARKRKHESLRGGIENDVNIDETESIKKLKTSPNEFNLRVSERRRLSKINADEPSTSKQSDISISDSGNIENMSDIDTSLNKNESLTEKDGVSISSKLKARILVRKYDRRLYKCIYCNQHYMKEASFDYHFKETHKLDEMPENYKCNICDLDFSRYTLPRHKYVHHEKMGLKREDFIILTETTYSKPPEEMVQINQLKDVKIDDRDDILESSSENCENDSVIDKDSTDICETKDDITENNIVINKMCYYKCFDCNVCFVDENMCSEHLIDHKALDPISYIECKICGFQFLIDFLKEHMVIHHSTEFKLENLTIHEYRVSENSDPKLDVYLAVDKVQSRLISTTTDVGVA